MRRRVAVLGASGIVAQRFQQRLVNHPWFELAAVFGSPDTSGKQLSDLPWRLEESRPNLPDLTVGSCHLPDLISQLEIQNIQLVFSALPSSVASSLERELVKSGITVFSNSSAHRMDSDVPLVIADLNPHHLLLLRPPFRSSGSGFLACSTNCTVVPVALPLKPLWDMIGIRHVKVKTEQALSGAGWELLQSAQTAGKVSREIFGEAEKVAEELQRLLGRMSPDGIGLAKFTTDVACSRVMRSYGHEVVVEATLSKECELEEILEWMQPYRGRAQALDLPSAPDQPFTIISENLDHDAHRWHGAQSMPADPVHDLRAGMSVVVSNISVAGRHLKFTAYSDNTLRGAAGGCVLLAELAHAEGLLD